MLNLHPHGRGHEHAIERVFCCAVCATHKRPLDVPYEQHSMGCPVRLALLSTAQPLPRGH